MVRETRHLWVGNLPENIREDRIREHFKRYGRVQSVKLLPRLKEDEGTTGLCATVAFMDIKSASKAHNMEHKLDERCLSTEYYEPAAIPGGSAAPIYVAPRFPHGPAEDHATFERSSHFYERREGEAYLRRPASGYHVPDPLRGRARDRLYRNGPAYTQLLERTQPAHHRALGNAWSYEGTPSVRYPPTTPTPDPYPEERRDVQPVAHKKRPKSSRSGSESGSNSGSSRSRSRSRSRSHSSSSSSQSGSSSCSSGTSSPNTDKSCSPHSSHHGTVRSGRVGGVALQSTVSAPHTNNVSPGVHSEDRRPLAICVRNLPIRSSDTSLKDGLFHEYKKHGKVTSVKVVGQAGDRYAIVCFKKADDAEKALEVSHDKLFFGCKIEVAPYQGYDVDDNEFRPYEAEQDEFHPKATRTLFIGNLEKDVTASELRKHFEQFGEIIEIDIKKQGGLSSYAFCQFADISSVVKAMRSMDGEHLGNNRIKLGFGKSMATNCVWVDGVAENVSDKYLNMQFHPFGAISHVTVDSDRGHALIYFEQVLCAQEAVREMRGFMLRGRKLQVDFASRECQEAFYEHLEKQGHAVVGGERPWERYDNKSREVQASRFETTVVVPGSTRFTRYEAPQRTRAASYNRNANSSVSTPVAASGTVAAVTQGRTTSRTQRVGQRYEYYDAEYPERRYRNYDEFSQGSGASHDDSYEQELRDYGYCQRERGDSSPSPITCESDGLRRSVAVVARPVRSDKSSSPCDKVEEDSAFKRHALQSVVVSEPQQAPPPLPPPPALPQHPPDIRHLQKERVHIQHLLEQLEDCTSSGDEDTSTPSLVPKKRLKLSIEECGGDPTGVSVGMCGVTVDGCFDGLNHGDGSATSLLVTTHNHRKSVSEVRRMSDVGKHCSRRLSTDSLSKHGSRDVRETSADRLVSVQVYSPHPVCKRRKTGSSASESEDRISCRSGKHSHHHHHHHNDGGGSVAAVSGSESVDGSRPGTPLCDERPENLLPPSEPRRIPRERTATDGPLSLPLPRFAAQVLSASPRLPVSISGTPSKSAPSTSIVSSPPSAVTSPRTISHPVHPLHPPPSPSPAPPPASPPPRPPSLLSSSSSDSEISPPSPTLEERIRSLDEKYEKWSGSRALSLAGGDVLAKIDASVSERFRFRHKFLNVKLTELQPSDIVKSVLAKRSVFDEDSKRLENFSDKYEPREFVPYTRTGCFQSLRVKTECAVGTVPQCGTPTKLAMSPSPINTTTTPIVATKLGPFPAPSTATQLPPRLMGTQSPLHSPSQPLPKSPFSGATPTTLSPVIKPPHMSLSPVGTTSCGKLQSMPKTTSAVSPRPAGTGLPAAKGLQYPFPSHPPVLPTTTVATTTATNAIGLVSVSSAGVKPSLSVTVPTTATGTVLSPEVSRTCGTKSSSVGSISTSIVHSLEVSRPSVVRTVSSVTVLTTATGTKPSAEVASRSSLKIVSSASTVLSTASCRVPSPGVQRLTCAKAPLPTITTTAVVGSVLSPEVARTPVSGPKCSSTVVSPPEVPPAFNTQTASRVSTATLSPPQATSRVTSPTVISSLQVTSRVSTTAAVKVPTCSTVTSVTTVSSPSSTIQVLTKLSRPIEPPPKISGSAPSRTEAFRPGSNIPSIKLPSFSPSSESLSIPITSPRVVIPVTVSSTITPIVTTVAAASTVTTTVMTVTMASTSVTSVTSTIFATSVVTPLMISAAESTKHGKPKSCIVTKKDSAMQSQLSSKDKQCDALLSNKPVPVLKKETLPLPAASSPTKKDVCLDVTRNSSNHKSKSVTVAEERRERKDSTGVLCMRRDSEREIEVSDKRRERSNSCDEKRRESIDIIDRRKEREVAECLERDRRKDSHSVEVEKERRRDNIDNLDKEKRKEKEVMENADRERRKEKENVDSMDRRKDVEFGEKERWKDVHMTEVDKERWKEREETQEKDRRKEANTAEGVQKEGELEKERRKERRKDRTSSSSSPASIGCKRRMSSQDSLESVPDDAKRLKLSPAVNVEHHKVPERRDSKDSGRSSSSSKRSSGERPRHGDKTFAKMLEDKIREERRQSKDDLDRRRDKDSKLQEGFERHKTKEKLRKKSKSDRDSPKEPGDLAPKPVKEPTNDKDFSPQSVKKKDDSEPEDREEKHRHLKREKEKKKQMKEEFGSTEFLEEKGKSTKKDREKRSSSERRKDENTIKEETKCMLQKKEQKSLKKEFSHSDTDSEDGSGDGPKKHSIFDIVDDGPAYISMYDKVKARSTKNMQKQEEEKRQEKMREKFNLLKQSRAKREEKKRSTSWDEDSDSDNPDRERGSKASKRLAKLMISSSSEDDGRLRSAYDCDDIKMAKGRPVVRIKKEDIIVGKSDSDSDAQQRHGKSVVIRDTKQLEGSEDDDGSARTKHLMSAARKGSRSKLVSDTSEDDNSSIGRFKPNAHKTPEIYSADSDVDLEYADSDEKPSHLKKPNTKSSKVSKNALDSSNDENVIKSVPDGVKVLSDKQLVFKKTIVKNKILESSDDENTKKLPCDPVKDDVFGDDKQAIFRKSIAKNKTCKISLDSSDDDSARKLLAESAKMNACIDEKHANFKKFTTKNKIKTSLDSSDDDTVRKISTDSLKNDMYAELIQPNFKKTFNKNKTTKLFPDSSGEESMKPFVLQSEKDDIFNDNIQLKVSLHNKGDLALENVSDVEPSPATPPQLEKVLFYSNSVGKGLDSPRKKSHKKKQKKQKLSQSSEEALSKILDHEAESFDKLQGDNCLPTEDSKIKGDSERKKHKRERRKSTHSKTSDGDGKPPKVRKKKSAKPELGVLKPESSLKREEKMEDIFGPLSDDSEPGHIKATPPPQNNGGRMFDKLPGKWQVSLVYGSDSDSNIDASVLNSRLEKERKRREKKRRERKAREEESLAVDLAEAGRALEAKLLDEDDYLEDASKPGLIKVDGVKQEPTTNDTDVFRFTDGDESLETSTTILLEKVKEKKKKRKKSKEEKQSRREHHHHHHHDKGSSKSSPERRSSVTTVMEESKLPSEPSPSLPTLDMPISPPLIKPAIPLPTETPHTVLQCHDTVINTAPKICPIVSKSNEKKKLEKFIPGFGSEIDDTIHETAVKSISEFEAPKSEAMLGVKVEETVKAEEMLPKSNGEGLVAEEEKPRAVISQEETEDAVKALLGESFGRGFGDCYVGEGNAGSGSAANSNPPEPQLPTDEEDETRKAVMGLIDMKPDTPQSEHELQIDTDTEDNVEESYPAIFSRSDDQPPRPPECIEFPSLPKTPELPPSFYSHHHHHHLGTIKPYVPTPSLPPPAPQVFVLPTTQASHKDKVPVEREVKVEPVEPIVKKEEVEEQVEPTNTPRSPSPTASQTAAGIGTDVVPLPVETHCKVEPKSEVSSEIEDCNSKQDKPLSPHQEEMGEKPTVLQEPPSHSPSPVIEKADIKVEKEDEIEETPVPVETPLVHDVQSASPQAPPSIKAQENLEQRPTTPVVDKDKPVAPSVPKEKSQTDVVEPTPVTQEQNAEMKESDTCKLNEQEVDTKVYDVPILPVTNTEDKSKSEANIEPVRVIDVDVNLAEKDLKENVPLVIDEKSQDGFTCDSKEDPVCDTRESEFSEPELDMKTDNDFVTNLLASDTMNQALTEDSTLVEDPRPLFVGSSESNFELFKDRDVESVSVIKETDAHQHRFKEEQDPFASPPKVSEAETVQLKEHLYGEVSIGKDDKEDEFMSKGDITNPIKVDSDFWSAKEVNIDSVIKKVDALCSVEELSPSEEMIDRDKLVANENKVWFSPLREKEASPVPETKPRDKLVVNENKNWFSPLREKEPSPVPEVKPRDKLIVNENKNWFSPLKEKETSPVPEMKSDIVTEITETPVEPESAPEEDAGQKVAIKVDEGREEVSSSTEQEPGHMSVSPLPEEREDHRITSASSPEDREHRATSSSSPEEEAHDGSLELDSQCHSTATPRTSRRGRRGAGGRRKMATRAVAGVMTRRTRLTAGRDPSSTPVSPRRGRGGRGAKVLTHESLAQVKQKLSTDVYEFRDDSEEEGNNGGEKGRPRLILTIKSPVSTCSINSTLGKDGSKPPPSPITSPVVETREEFPTTRKSRRLQERDGSRTTVDDVIEDVVRGAAIVTRSAAAAAAAANLSIPPRRSTRQNNGGQKPTITIVEPRKSPRGTRKQMFPNRGQDDSSDEKKKSEEDSPSNKLTGEVVSTATATTPITVGMTMITTSSTTTTTTTTSTTPITTTTPATTTSTSMTTTTTIPVPSAVASSTETSLDKVAPSITSGILSSIASKPQQASQGNPLLMQTSTKDAGTVDREPMTLIDPVTGLLIPMRESEEGQYIPVTTAATSVGNLPLKSTNTTATSTVSTRPVPEPVDFATNEVEKNRARPASLASTTIKTSPLRTGSDAISSGNLWTSGALTQSHVPVIANPSQTHASGTAVRPLGICKPGTMPSPLPSKPTPTTMLLGTTGVRPIAAFKAHVLQQPGKVVTASLQQPASTQTHTLKAIHHTAQPVIKSTLGPTLPSPVPTTALAKPRDVLPGQTPLALSTVKGGPSTVAVNPKAYLLQAVSTNKPLTTSGQSVTTGPSPVSSLSVTKVHGLTGQPQKTVGPAVSLNPKTHLLQAAPKTGVPPGTYTTLQIPAGSKAGLMHHHSASASPPGQKPHGTMSKTVTASPPLPQPPKAHHGLAQQPILTGAVASPPLKVPHHGSQQPVVTGASSSRAGVPKPQVPSLPGPHLAPHAKGLMDPPKVEVSIGGCIVVPTASPQQRGQVMQAGLPVPAYEASLHAGSAGVVAELLPNPQFVLAQRQSPPPAHQHGGQGEVVQHVAFSHNMRVPSHELAPHYVHPQLVYQQYLRAHQEAMGAHIPYHLTPGAVRSPMLPGMDVKSEPESEEARGSSPPLELRRPASGGSSLGARGGGMAAHSLQSPHDRATDSPQVATVYVQHAARLAHYTPAQPQQPPRYYEPGPEPPPAHLRNARHHHPMPGTEAPSSQPRLQVATPPHASQVPPQADSLLMLLQRYPVMWQGLLALKNDQAAVQMHFVFGNPHVARDSLPCNSDGSTPPLRISQRMRLEQTQVEGVARKMQMDNEHCMLLALPCGRDHMDVLQQSNNLQTGFITYLQQKQAAGIVNIAAPGSQQAAYVVHIFPSCDFANENLARIAPDLLHRVADIAHLLIIIATV